MIHTDAKFTTLDFRNKKMKGKRTLFYPNRTSPLGLVAEVAQGRAYQIWGLNFTLCTSWPSIRLCPIAAAL